MNETERMTWVCAWWIMNSTIFFSDLHMISRKMCMCVWLCRDVLSIKKKFNVCRNIWRISMSISFSWYKHTGSTLENLFNFLEERHNKQMLRWQWTGKMVEHQMLRMCAKVKLQSENQPWTTELFNFCFNKAFVCQSSCTFVLLILLANCVFEQHGSLSHRNRKVNKIFEH